MNALANAEGAILPTLAPPLSAVHHQQIMVGEGKAWGLSASIDLHNCDPQTIRSRVRIREFVIALCELIGMKRYGDCQIVHFGEGRVAGFSMTQLIETSLISGHFADATNGAYLDIFSCKEYDPAAVEGFAKTFFGAGSSSRTVTLRR